MDSRLILETYPSLSLGVYRNCIGQQFAMLELKVAIALILLILVNILVICVPTIRDIFGFIGQYCQPWFLVLSTVGLALKLRLTAVPFCPSGSTSAPSLIFILPSVFYLRIVPTEVEPLFSWPKIQVSIPGSRVGGRGSILKRDYLLQDAEKCKELHLDGAGEGSSIQERREDGKEE